MRKTFFILLAALIAISCNPRVDFNELMEDDYINTSLEFPNSSVRFYEVQAVLSGPCGDVESEILASSTIIQIGRDTIKEIDRTFHDGRIVEQLDTLKLGPWDGDLPIILDSVKYSLGDAFNIVREHGSTPEDPFVAFRRALRPPFRLQYIFGGRNSYYIFVDAATGELTVEEPS